MSAMARLTGSAAFSPDDLRIPLIQAPMAGRISTPALAAAVGRAGGLSFLAAGYLGPDAVAAQIAEVRRSVDLFGVNVFVPQPVVEPERVAAYPALNQLTRPLRAAAAKQGDPDGMGMYAGTNFRLAQAASAAEILASLAEGTG